MKFLARWTFSFYLFFLNENRNFIPMETQKLPEISWVDQFPVIGYVICLYQLPLEEIFGFFMNSDCIGQ